MALTNGSAEPTPETATRIERNTVGALILAAGLTGLFLPFLQAVLMVAVGIAVLDLPVKARAHRWMLQWAFYQGLARQWNRLLAWWCQRAG